MEDKWQPIETAPKDGTEIIAFRDDAGAFIVRWDAAVSFMTSSEIDEVEMSEEDLHNPGWFFADFIQGGRLWEAFTHWQPLPSPRKERSDENLDTQEAYRPSYS